MSIETKQIIHIASEVLVIGGITFYFENKIGKLNDKVDELQSIIQQQSEMIQQHDNLILKLLNTVATLQTNQQKNGIFTSSQQPMIPPKKKVDETLPQNISNKKQVLIVVPNPLESLFELPQHQQSNSVVEEIFDEDNLDDELLEELKELEEEEKKDKKDTKNNKIEKVVEIEDDSNDSNDDSESSEEVVSLKPEANQSYLEYDDL